MNLDGLTHKALLPVYEQVLNMIDRYSTDKEIDLIVNKIRSLLGLPIPDRPTYPETNDEDTLA
jgi:hypothetical protein